VKESARGSAAWTCPSTRGVSQGWRAGRTARGGLSRVVLEDGSSVEREGLFYAPPQRQRSALAETLRCEVTAMGPASEVVKADPMTRETSVAGVYAAGDAGSPMQSIALASSSGATAAAFVNHALCTEDAEASSAGNGDATGGAAARS
jgi:thioredoxin reductase